MQIFVKSFFLKFLLFLPLLFAIAENTTGYFPGGVLNPGTIRGGITAVFLSFFLIKYYPKENISLIILSYIFYYFVLSFTSSNPQESLYGFFKFFIATMMFPVGYYFIDNYHRFQALNKSYLAALIVFVINIIIANIFNLGTSDYLEDSFYFGAGRVNITKMMVILLIAVINLIPILNNKQKRIFVVFIAIVSFFTILGIKRSVLLSFGVSFVIFIFYNRLNLGFIKIVVLVIVATLFTLLLYPKAFSTLEARYLVREDQIGLNEETLETEARVSEFELVLNTYSDGGIKHKLFGSELFNDRSFFKSDRMLHIDYSVILSGSGFIGLFFWFAILIGIFFKGKYYLNKFKDDFRFTFLKASFFSIIASQLILSIAGTIQGIGLRTYILLYLGAIIGTLRGEYRQMVYLKETNND